MPVPIPVNVSLDTRGPYMSCPPTVCTYAGTDETAVNDTDVIVANVKPS